jgi:phosphatidylglycerophosphate synthase
MERMTILAPAAFGVGLFVAMLGIYTILSITGRLADLGAYRSNEILGPFWAGFIVWLIRPLERALIVARVSPTHITAISLALSVGAGLAVAFGHLATGAWLFIIGGILDLLDGRLARALNQQTPQGALFDSVADRWGELALFTGFAWYLRDEGPWLLAVMFATSGSFMVSYTRARAEALGLRIRSGAMQRAERIVLVSIGSLIAAWLAAGEQTATLAPKAIGLALTTCGALATATALGRWISAHRALVARSPRRPSETTVGAHGLEIAVEHAKVGEVH